MSSTERDAEYARYRDSDRFPDDVMVSEHDFGDVIGIAFRWGAPGEPTQRRIGVPLTIDMAMVLWRRLGKQLGCGG